MTYNDGFRTGRIVSDYDPDTFLNLTRTMDGDIVISVSGSGEFRIATSGSRLSGDKLVKIITSFSKIIDALND
jgi:hypothetical protein